MVSVVIGEFNFVVLSLRGRGDGRVSQKYNRTVEHAMPNANPYRREL